MVHEQALWITSNCKISLEKYRDTNPILTTAKILVDAKKDFERERRMAKNIHVENTEKAIIRIGENNYSQFWKIFTARKSQMVTCEVTRTELENLFITI